jgi:GNAT superfamily N-acetyltransferase
VHFRKATFADIGSIVSLVNASYRGTGGRSGWTTEEHLVEGARILPAELLSLMEDPAAHFELALGEDDVIIGNVFLRQEDAHTCYLGMLSVDPERQATGIGRALLARSETLAREWGCARVRITVLDARPELLAWYERRGYSRTGRSHDFPETTRSHLKIPGIQLVEMEHSIMEPGTRP